MSLSTESIADIEQYKSLSSHVVGILDNEAKIASEVRLLTPANITALNELYANTVEALNQIIEEQIALP